MGGGGMIGSTRRCLGCCFDTGLMGELSQKEDIMDDAVDGVPTEGVFTLFLEKSSVHLLGDEVLDPEVDPVSSLGTGEDPTLVN